MSVFEDLRKKASQMGVNVFGDPSTFTMTQSEKEELYKEIGIEDLETEYFFHKSLGMVYVVVEEESNDVNSE